MILELDNKNRHDTFFEKEDNITIVGRLEEFNLNLDKKVTCLFPVQTLISFGNLGVFLPTILFSDNFHIPGEDPKLVLFVDTSSVEKTEKDFLEFSENLASKFEEYVEYIQSLPSEDEEEFSTGVRNSLAISQNTLNEPLIAISSTIFLPKSHALSYKNIQKATKKIYGEKYIATESLLRNVKANKYLMSKVVKLLIGENTWSSTLFF